MSRRAAAAVAVALAVAAPGCRGDHHGHDHGEARDDAAPTSFTVWSATHELFVEHPPLVVGEAAPMAAHLTRLDGHLPITSGALVVELVQADGTVVRVVAEAPRRPGIYAPAPTPTAPGPCTLRVRHDAGPGDELVAPCEVHVTAAAVPAAPEEPPGRIALLKEQAWTIGLIAEPAAPRPLTPTLRTTGELRAAAGREARLTAPARGRVTLAAGAVVLGAPVARGQVLATIEPRLDDATGRGALDADVRAARAELVAAEQQVARSERLWEARTIPERQLEEARTRVEVARARVAAAAGRLGHYDVGASGRGRTGAAYQVRAPIAGTVVAIHAASGQSVEEGAPLVDVVDLERVWLRADVFEPDIAAAAGATGASFRVDGSDVLHVVAPPDGRLVAVAPAVDRATRTVPVIFELANPDRTLRIGSFVTVFLATGEPVEALAIPEAAIVHDAGRPVAYVQVGGEAFERRVLELGLRVAGWVEVRAGIVPGERVVVRGAYDVKLAAAGGAAAGHGHGHDH